MELVLQVGGFTVSKGDDGVGQVSVRANERLGGACFAVSMVPREGQRQELVRIWVDCRS